MLSLNIPSPIIRLDHPSVRAVDCELYVKREDLIHPDFGGNKWRKLKYNIEQYKKGSYSNLITFGGAFSNHIAATASICNKAGIPCTAIIRGGQVDENNPTLIKAEKLGMNLFRVSRAEYKQKEKADTVKAHLAKHAKPLVIPEGGSNRNARKGVMELMEEVHAEGVGFDYLVVSAGTGMTAAGIISGSISEEVLVINALKNESLKTEINSFLEEPKDNWSIHSDYTFGGYAKVTKELSDFINQINRDLDLPLDPIYNGKAFYACLDLATKKQFRPGSKILYIHTGGLQGVTAFNYVNKDPEKELMI